MNAGIIGADQIWPSPARNESRTNQWNRGLPSLRTLSVAQLPRVGRIHADPVLVAGDSSRERLAHPGPIGVAGMPDPLPA